MSRYLSALAPATTHEMSAAEHMWLLLTPTAVTLLGIFLAIVLHRRKQKHGAVLEILKEGGGLDWLYRIILVKPYVKTARAVSCDFLESFMLWIAAQVNTLITVVANWHTGRLTHYLSFFLLAALTIASVMVLQ